MTDSTHPADRRLDRTCHLMGEQAMERIGSARVMVVGLGGVGSWAAEMLLRNGVHSLLLVDFDVVAATDLNRQVQATPEVIGQLKAVALANRLRAICSEAEIEVLCQRFDSSSAAEILDRRPDCVLDAIDLMTDKGFLIDACLKRGVRLVTTMGAAARLDPTRIEVADLAFTKIDPMARAVRQILRHKYGYPLGEPLGVPAVFSTEPRQCQPKLPRADEPGPAPGLLRKKAAEGSLGCVTAAFGMAAAAVVLRWLAGADRSDGGT